MVQQEIYQQKQSRTPGRILGNLALLGFAGIYAYHDYQGFLNLQPHLGTPSVLPYVEDHASRMIPFAIGRTIDMGSTLWTMNQFVKTGTPRSEVHKNELGPFARQQFRLWYAENKKGAAIASAVGLNALLVGWAFAQPEQWSLYLPIGIFLGITNTAQGIDARRKYEAQKEKMPLTAQQQQQLEEEFYANLAKSIFSPIEERSIINPNQAATAASL